MQIVSSIVDLSSSRQYVERHEQRESLRTWRDGAEPRESTVQGAGGRSLRAEAVAFEASYSRVEISQEAMSLQSRQVTVEGDDEASMEPMVELEYSLVKLMVEAFTGKAITVYTPGEAHGKPKPDEAMPEQAVAKGRDKDAAPSSERQGWGMVYDYYESHYEAESTRFSAKGMVSTADGKEIAIEVELNMSREFLTEEQMRLRAGDALKDPLVINFSGTAAELTQTRFSFDIDADGHEDQIAFVEAGSGFLALDANGDGVVNDGSELFGALSGDGFAELAAYDEDGNQWIDESDSIYARLRIWSRDAEGNDQLVGLGARDVGAIYLGNVGTSFALNDTDNNQLGQVRSSGIFLEEDGGVGTVQQIDLVV